MIVGATLSHFKSLSGLKSSFEIFLTENSIKAELLMLQKCKTDKLSVNMQNRRKQYEKN